MGWRQGSPGLQDEYPSAGRRTEIPVATAVVIIALLGITAPDEPDARTAPPANLRTPFGDYGRVAAQIPFGVGNRIESGPKCQWQAQDRTAMIHFR
jgi:hypothetical protein